MYKWSSLVTWFGGHNMRKCYPNILVESIGDIVADHEMEWTQCSLDIDKEGDDCRQFRRDLNVRDSKHFTSSFRSKGRILWADEGQGIITNKQDILLHYISPSTHCVMCIASKDQWTNMTRTVWRFEGTGQATMYLLYIWRYVCKNAYIVRKVHTLSVWTNLKRICKFMHDWHDS